MTGGRRTGGAGFIDQCELVSVCNDRGGANNQWQKSETAGGYRGM